MLGITSKGELVDIAPDKEPGRNDYIALILFKGDLITKNPIKWDIDGIKHSQLNVYLQDALHKSLRQFRHDAGVEKPLSLRKFVLFRFRHGCHRVITTIDRLLEQERIQNLHSR